MRRAAPTLLAGVLLALFWWMAVSVSPEHSTTADEIFHVTAGYSYWKFGDYRLQPENGNLPQRLAALPLLVQDVRFPSLDQTAWRDANAAEIGHQFFYESGNDLPRMLLSARAMIALLGVACGLLVFAWSRSLFGVAGAMVSLVMFSFCPHMLAHAGLATSDMAAALGFLVMIRAGWRLLHRVTLGRIFALAGAAALLVLSKFSAPLLVPLLGGMALVRILRGIPLPLRVGPYVARLRGWRAAAAQIGAVVCAALVAWALVWAAFGFRYAALAGPGQLNHPWATVLMKDVTAAKVAQAAHLSPEARAVIQPGVVQAAVTAMREIHLLPEAWLYGLAHVDRFARMRPAFFMGEFRTTGWKEFFPVAFALKTPFPVLILLVLALPALVLRKQASAARSRLIYRLAPLAILLAIYGAFALTSHLNIGHRHILPIYPVLYILTGAVVHWFQRRWLLTAVVALLSWHVWSSVAIRPNYLAYFNSLLGGPARAYEHFVDSSLDWGQDLPGLKRWLDRHVRGEKIYLSYFGSGSPAYEGITATRLADGYFDLRARELMPAMHGGIFCISATMFQQVYTHVRHGWTPLHEQCYQDLRPWLDDWRAGRDQTPRDVAISRMTDLEHLRFGRLCAGLQARKPDDQVGYSILIFRLTDTEVRALLEGPPPFTP